MNFSAWSIRHPVPAILLFAMLTVLGLLAFQRLGVQNFPDMDLPTISIAATLEGAAPAQLETEVARIIEDKLASLSHIDHVTTTITSGTVSIRVSFRLEKDSEVALNEVRNAVDSATADLPAQMQAPSVTKVTMQSAALVTYAIRSAQLNETELSWFIDNDMTKALLSAPGVGRVSRVGGIDRQVHVDLDPATMAGLDVTAAAVTAQLKSVQSDTSGGLGEVGGARQTLRTLGAVDSIDALRELRIPLANGQQVRLGEVASIEDSFADRSSLAYLDGQPVTGVQIMRSNGFSDVGVATNAEQAMQRFAAAYPNVQIEKAYSTVGRIADNYHGSMLMLYEGALLAVVVVWLFLRDWRATILSAVALPLSVIPTFLVMHLAGFSLNIVTLLALSLVVGILVDDAIAASSDLFLTIPRRAAENFADDERLRLMEPPVKLPIFGYRMVWHERVHAEPDHAWLRRLVLRAVRTTSDETAPHLSQSEE
jgi:multidrug efflux pump subunit AcrB